MCLTRRQLKFHCSEMDLKHYMNNLDSDLSNCL